MEIREISLWSKFKCQGSKCPDTCCRGWIIPLTTEDRIRFLKAPGLLKFQLGFAMLGSRLGDFNSSCKDCPFMNKYRLCKLQLKHGHEFIPETCRSYPRAYRNYGAFEERYVDLSCIEVARLFMENYEDLHLVSSEGSPESDLYGTNDDTDFLNDLVNSRSLILDELARAESFEALSRTLAKIDAYAKRTQDAFIHGHEDFLKTDPFDRFETDHDKTDAPEGKNEVFPLGASAVNYLMNTSLVSDYLKYGSPYIYEIFSIYTSQPSGTYTEKRLRSIREAYHGACPGNARIYAAYYSYYLYKFYLNCYEDYSFVKNIRMGFIHLGMIEFLHTIYFDKYGKLDTDEFAHIMSSYNKRAYFNYENLDSMYEVFIADFF